MATKEEILAKETFNGDVSDLEQRVFYTLTDKKFQTHRIAKAVAMLITTLNRKGLMNQGEIDDFLFSTVFIDASRPSWLATRRLTGFWFGHPRWQSRRIGEPEGFAAFLVEQPAMGLPKRPSWLICLCCRRKPNLKAVPDGLLFTGSLGTRKECRYDTQRTRTESAQRTLCPL